MFSRLFIKCSPQLFRFGLGAVGEFSFDRQLRLQVSNLFARRPSTWQCVPWPRV
jgi:hypothetical protein